MFIKLNDGRIINTNKITHIDTMSFLVENSAGKDWKKRVVIHFDGHKDNFMVLDGDLEAAACLLRQPSIQFTENAGVNSR